MDASPGSVVAPIPLRRPVSRALARVGSTSADHSPLNDEQLLSGEGTKSAAFLQPRYRHSCPAAGGGSPAGKVAERLTVAPRLTGRPLPPAPRIVGLRAVTLPDGRVRLTWRLSRPARDRDAFLSVGLHARNGWTLDQRMVRPRGRTHFAVTLSPDAIEAGVGPMRPARADVQLTTSATLNAATATVPVG